VTATIVSSGFFGGHGLPERTESCLVEIVTIDGPTDLETLEAEVIDRPIHLCDRHVDVLERNRRPVSTEPVRMISNGLSQRVVLHPRRLGCGLRRGPVEVLRDKRGQALNIDAHRIHRLDPGRGRRQLVDDAREHHLVVILRILPHEVVVRLVLGPAMRVCQRIGRRSGQVAVNVDRWSRHRASFSDQ
jgi:hypothetical protein